jgi:hypothetical protein
VRLVEACTIPKVKALLLLLLLVCSGSCCRAEPIKSSCSGRVCALLLLLTVPACVNTMLLLLLLLTLPTCVNTRLLLLT